MREKAEDMNRELQLTADGSHTLFIPQMDEHYHSVNGAVQESRHVFIEAGLHLLQNKRLTVLEIGFGTGLNAFLTLLDSEISHQSIYYYSFERYPLEMEMVGSLNYAERICPDKKNVFHALHRAAWDNPVRITPYFTLHKIQGDSNKSEMPSGLDLVYFDAFAPDKQPEMWNREIFDKLFAGMNKGGVLTTYCAKGMVRRMMKEAGYTVERIPDPLENAKCSALLNYKSASILETKVFLGAAPTCLSTILPSLKKRIVGILRIPNWATTSLLLSTSIFPIVTRPSYSVANSSMIGPTIRQGPHHSAQKSRTIGLPEFTNSSKFSSVICSAIL